MGFINSNESINFYNGTDKKQTTGGNRHVTILSNPITLLPKLGAMLLTAFCVWPTAVLADDAFRIGLRGGVAAENVNSEEFSRNELFLIKDLPWRWQWPNWRLQTQLNAAIGTLKGGERTAFIASLGQGVALRYRDWPLVVDIGTGPTFISRDTFDNADLGGQFHFTSYLGLTLPVTQDWHIAYRFQHVSNASLERVNPGLDTHTIEFSLTF